MKLTLYDNKTVECPVYSQIAGLRIRAVELSLGDFKDWERLKEVLEEIYVRMVRGEKL